MFVTSISQLTLDDALTRTSTEDHMSLVLGAIGVDLDGLEGWEMGRDSVDDDITS